MPHEHHGDMALSNVDKEELSLEGSCSHCMMRSHSVINSPLTPMVLNNSASHGIVAAASTIVWASVPSSLTFVDVREHGPPGLNSSRYILNSSFRI